MIFVNGKDGNGRFTTVPLKALSDQDELDINVYNLQIIFIFGFITKGTCAFLLKEFIEFKHFIN